MTTVITALMVQIISAITTTHQCVTRDIIDKNDRYSVLAYCVCIQPVYC